MYLKLDDVAQLEFVNEHPRDLALHLEDEEGAFSIECLIFEATEQGVRALFKHGSFELADRPFKPLHYSPETSSLTFNSFMIWKPQNSRGFHFFTLIEYG